MTPTSTSWTATSATAPAPLSCPLRTDRRPQHDLPPESPTVEFWFNTVGFVLLGAGALWIVVALVRREMRIRRRLDAIRNEPSAVREWRTARAPEPRHTSTDRRSA
jgi:hypothetical protein